jgi:hypothetical protein
LILFEGVTAVRAVNGRTITAFFIGPGSITSDPGDWLFSIQPEISAGKRRLLFLRRTTLATRSENSDRRTDFAKMLL